MKRVLGLERPLVLSPMVDVTDAAFRSVAKDFGAEITCSEMVSAAGLVQGNHKSRRLIEPWPGEHPYGVQIMGGDPETMAQAVRIAIDEVHPDFVDLNLGCPSPNILRSCAGGFLLRDPSHAGKVIQACVDAAGDTPLSVKMRLGHDREHLTFVDVGREAEAAGAAWCTLHGRTVVQGYSGEADWDAIGTLVEALDIPVIGNGDLRGPDDLRAMHERTHCAGYFIARAAMHDPTIFRALRAARDDAPTPPAAELVERLQALQTYLERAGKDAPIPLAVLKRQVTRFLSGAPGAKALRQRVHTAHDAEAILAVVHSKLRD